MIKNYALVNSATNIVEKIVYWDGLQPITIHDAPPEYQMILVEDKPALVWDYNFDTKQQFLSEKLGLGSPGMIWDGTKFSMTAESKPSIANISTTGVNPF
jgi:hypothetical protein